jgi:ABC-type nitrate/sulfonate/bicarbonate transport system ATPase subunit
MQRVSIARAFAIDPEIMLMDEPFSSLDTELADSLLRELRQVLVERRVTAIYVTHDLTEALSLADRLLQITPSGLEQVTVHDREQMLREYYANRLNSISST